MLFRRLSLLLGAALLSGCASFVTGRVADTLATQGASDETDLQLAREASAFYLKVSESVLKQDPTHLALATSVTSGFTQYSYAFVDFESDKMESQDAKAAKRLRDRAARLYARARQHGLRALEPAQPGLRAALATGPVSLAPERVALAYWTAAAWGAEISLSKQSPDAVADLPLAVNLARSAFAREPGFADGSLASLVATLEASRPGGSRAEAQRLFEQARGFGQSRNAGVFVAEAESLALPAGDRAAFEALLRQALAVAAAHPGLGNAVMAERAQWLLDTVDDRF